MSAPTDNPRTNAFGAAYGAILGAPPLLSGKHAVAWVDLRAGQEAWNKVRDKQCRYDVKWGARNLLVEEASAPHDFDGFREFHARVAGRVTRPLASWEVSYDEVRAGRGALVLGYQKGVLVSGALFVDGAKICVYWSSVRDRSISRPLSHIIVARGIELAADRGLEWLELGEVPERGAASEKECTIGDFKRGFATHILPPGGYPLGPADPSVCVVGVDG